MYIIEPKCSKILPEGSPKFQTSDFYDTLTHRFSLYRTSLSTSLVTWSGGRSACATGSDAIENEEEKALATRNPAETPGEVGSLSLYL